MTLTTKRPITINEFRELMLLMEVQETSEKYVNTSLHIKGKFAIIEVKIDEDGNITLL